MHPTEEVTIHAFIASHRRDRWLLKLESNRHRGEILDRLNHCADLDPRNARWLASNTDVVGLLKSHGAPEVCYVLSACESIDGREMPLEEAVAKTESGGWGTLVSCIPGRLAYYYDEGGARRALLTRNAPD